RIDRHGCSAARAVGRGAGGFAADGPGEDDPARRVELDVPGIVARRGGVDVELAGADRGAEDVAGVELDEATVLTRRQIDESADGDAARGRSDRQRTAGAGASCGGVDRNDAGEPDVAARALHRERAA